MENKKTIDPYLSEVIDSSPRMTKDKAITLLDLYRATGDLAVRDDLVKGNLRFILMISIMFHRQYRVNVTESFQVASMTFLRAIEGYRPELGFAFHTYAGRSIWKSLLSEYRKRQRKRRRNRSEIALEEDLISVEQEPGDDYAEQIEQVKFCLSLVDPRERFVLEHRFGILGRVWTLDEVGTELHITRERVRQIEQKALERIRCRTAWMGHGSLANS